MTKFALLCTMLPDRDGNIKLRMHSEVFDTLEEAENMSTVFRHQNLPFRSRPVRFDDITE